MDTVLSVYAEYVDVGQNFTCTKMKGISIMRLFMGNVGNNHSERNS